MLKQAYTLLLSPRGRIDRLPFIVGIAGFLALTLCALFLFSKIDMGSATASVGLLSFFLFLHVAMCVYGKRLHDVGRTLWPWVVMIVLLIIMLIFIGLSFGGVEYFDTVMAHPEYAENEAKMAEVLKVYQDTLDQHALQSRGLIAVVPVLFTLWLALAKGEPKENRYGPASRRDA